MSQIGFGRIVTTIPRRLIGRCRNVDSARTSNPQSFHQRVKCYIRVERWHRCGPPMIQFVFLEKGKVRIGSFRENICYPQ